ncbi:unnamed protein product [Linum tenue]|uniref:RRM domain-containing protein n=1 Tax=Linum tenue TaxID=586396 RepID=A0AAV0JN55_9ROSI|nr:unnamed protein product [Linum tenue]
MVERDTGRPRGFGFITFADRRGMEDAIREMHGRELGDRPISVNKAQPKMGEDVEPGYRGGGYSDNRYKGGGYPSGGGRGGRYGGGRGGGGSAFPSRSRFGGPPADREDRFGGERDRYMDDRYDGGRYADRDRFESRDKYGTRDRFASDRYLHVSINMH